MPISTITNALGIKTSTNLTTFKLFVGGKLVDGVISFAIEHKLNTVPKAFILISDGDAARQTFERSTKKNIKPGNNVQIKLGYHSLEEIVFEGVMVSQSIKINKARKSNLQLVCKDPTYRMALVKNSNYYRDTTDQEILKELVKKHKDVSLKVDFLNTSSLTPERYTSQIQHNSTDWDYLIARAEINGLYASVENGAIKLSGVTKVVLPAYKLQFGIDIIDLDIELNAETQFESLTAQSWNNEKQKLVQSESRKSLLPDAGSVKEKELKREVSAEYLIKHAGNLSEKQLKKIVQARNVKSALSKIKGTITFQGSHAAKPNQFILLQGLGAKFNGLAYVSGVSHQVRKGNWVTTVQIGMESGWHAEKYDQVEQVEKISASDVSGLYTGIVKQVDKDPMNNLRILVNMPSVDENSKGSWMRMASMDASEDKGFVNRPDVGDEVLIGFINNDINHGVILGSLYSKKNKGSDLLAPTSDNNIKGWVIKPDMHLIFDAKDDVVELVTASGNSVRIDQDVVSITDQFKNEIILNDGGITINTDKDLNLNAKGDVNITGKNVNIEANAALALKGKTAEYSASSNNTIKGNPVNIN